MEGLEEDQDEEMSNMADGSAQCDNQTLLGRMVFEMVPHSHLFLLTLTIQPYMASVRMQSSQRAVLWSMGNLLWNRRFPVV